MNPDTRALFHFLTTLSEAVVGFILANLIAFALAILFQYNAFARGVVLPLAIALKATPIIALAPIILIWFGSGFVGKVISAAIVCFFPMLVGLYSAMNQTPQNFLEYGASLGATKWQKLYYIMLPHSVPEIFSALRVSSTLAVVGAVVAEFIGSRVGLGYMILTSSYQFQTPTMFAGIFLTALVGLVLYASIGTLEYLFNVSRWRM